MPSRRRRVVHIDLTGSNCGPDFLSVDVVVVTPWPDSRIREEAALYYAVPLKQVGEPREAVDDADPWPVEDLEWAGATDVCKDGGPAPCIDDICHALGGCMHYEGGA